MLLFVLIRYDLDYNVILINNFFLNYENYKHILFKQATKKNLNTIFLIES